MNKKVAVADGRLVAPSARCRCRAGGSAPRRSSTPATGSSRSMSGGICRSCWRRSTRARTLSSMPCTGWAAKTARSRRFSRCCASPIPIRACCASALAMHKPMAKTLFARAGLPVVEGVVAAREELAAQDPMPAPFVVKPTNQGSSVGVRIVRVGDNSWREEVAGWSFGAEMHGRALHSRARADGRGDRRPCARVCEILAAWQLLRLHGEICRGRLGPSGPGADPESDLPRGPRHRVGGACGARLPRRQPGGSALRRHPGRRRPTLSCSRSTPSRG